MIPAALHALREFLSGPGALILPEVELLLFALGIFLIGRWLAEDGKKWNPILALGGTAFSSFTLYVQHGKMRPLSTANPEMPGLLGFHQSVLVDAFFLYFAALFLAVTALVVLFSMKQTRTDGRNGGRFYALLLLGCAGMMLMASGVDVLVVLLGVEVLAVTCFVLVKLGPAASAAARSYAALWVCSSVALVLGFLLLCGQFQTTNLGKIGATLDVRLENGVAYGGLTNWHAILALACVATGIFLLIEAAPLHFFAPGIYEFAPAPVAAYFGAAAKAAGCALLLRLFSFLFLFAHEKWRHVWGGAAILSLVWGTVAAVRQNRVRRLLAYGSVAQTGFFLLGLVAANEDGFHGMIFFAGMYVFSLTGVLGVLMLIEQQGAPICQLSDLRGLWRRSRIAASGLLVFVMSLAGLPATAGFVGKLYIIKGLIEAPHPQLAAFAVLCAVAAVYYYGRIALSAFQGLATEASVTEAGAAEPTPLPPFTIGYAESVALTVAVFVSLAAGLYPEPFLHMAQYAFGQ